MKTRIIASLLSNLLLLSCTTTVGISPTVTETSVQPTYTPKPTAVIETTKTPAPVPTQSYTRENIPICPKSGSVIDPPHDFGIPGTIVYQKDYRGLYTVGGSPLSYAELPVNQNQKITSLGFSPDGQWLAFSPMEISSNGLPSFKNAEVVLLSADGVKIEQTLPVEQFSEEIRAHQLLGFSGYSHWINNTTVYSALYYIDPDSPTRHIYDLPKVMDPFIGVWREDLLEALPNGSKSYGKGISPDLTRMLYMNGDGLFLKDLENGGNIWHDYDLFAGFGALMFWTPDSQTVAYASLYAFPDEKSVVLISRDGMALPIMGHALPLSGLLIDDIKWSPDGKYLALLVWEGEEIGETIFIYDFAAQKYVSQCPIPRSDDQHPSIIWSPDNKYLAYAGMDYPLIIMNVQSGELIQLVDKARAVGWSGIFPVKWNPR